MKSILVVGGAGYIGSFMCKYLSRNGYEPVVLDNLSRGHREAVRWGPFYNGCMSDRELLDRIITEREIRAVMHFAAYLEVGESVQKPSMYYRNNVTRTLDLLDSMVRNRVGKFIFSSSCATYGEPVEIPITENHPQNPISPYGRTKLMVEGILGDFHSAYGIDSVSLRYFNAAGADPECETGEAHSPETHLIPLVLEAASGKRDAVYVFGDDYPTPDGSCVRDYIHIEDLAQAHLLALEKLLQTNCCRAYNLGNGEGHSVKQVVETAREVTGAEIVSKIVARRPGDPAVLIGSSEKAMKELAWRPRRGDLKEIVRTAWDWHRSRPDGYRTVPNEA